MVNTQKRGTANNTDTGRVGGRQVATAALIHHTRMLPGFVSDNKALMIGENIFHSHTHIHTQKPEQNSSIL